MKKQLALVACLLVFAATSTIAQTIYDAAGIAERELNGTARFVGMGGSMNALGGDISTINTNPAGIGIYRSNDFMVTMGMSNYGMNFDKGQIKNNKTRFDFDNIGFVYSNHVGNNTSLRYINFGFNYSRSKSLFRNSDMGNGTVNYSQTDLMAAQAKGIESWGDNPFDDNNIGWLSAMGWEAVLIEKLNAGSNQYKSVFPYESIVNTFYSEERGGVDEFDFNIAFNYNDRFYLGFTLGAYSVNYKKYFYFGEDYGNQEGYDLQSWNKIKGSGVDFKVGTIFRPIESSPLRIGVAIHTPTFYSLDYRTTALGRSDVLSLEGDAIESYTVRSSDYLSDRGEMVREFQLRTPWTFSGSVGYTIGSEWALDAEYEFKDYSSMKFYDGDGNSEYFDFENSTTDMLKGVSTFRIGMEYKPVASFALRAGYNYSSAIFKDDAYQDLPYYSIQTDTDFRNSKALNVFTLGVGYRSPKIFYADLAFKYAAYNTDLSPTVNAVGDTYVYDMKYNRAQALLTLGVRF